MCKKNLDVQKNFIVFAPPLFYLDAVVVKIRDYDIVVTIDRDEMRPRKLMIFHSSGPKFVDQSSIGSVVHKNLEKYKKHY